MPPDKSPLLPLCQRGVGGISGGLGYPARLFFWFRLGRVREKGEIAESTTKFGLDFPTAERREAR